MKFPPLPANEDQRLRRLIALGVLDTAAEPVLDAFTTAAAALTGMPIALLSLVDQDRQWMKSALGVPQGFQTPRTISFCGHAIAGQDDVFEVEDALEDERFCDNPLVLGPPQARHYAGASLVMPGGERMGTLCVIGTEPGRLSPVAADVLVKLARAVVQVLLLRESNQDLHARLAAERALRESEASFRALAHSLPQLVWRSRRDGKIDFVNHRWAEFTGGTSTAVNPSHWNDLIHPEDLQHVSSTWRRSIDTGAPFDCEYRLRNKEGEWRWVLALARPAQADDGELLHWIGTLTDIHDQKLTQQELALANQRKDEFLAMLAHELRNPLAPISTAAQVLRMAPDDSARVLKSGELIARQVQHMTALVDDLLDVSRVTRGLVSIDRHPVDLREAVEEALEQSRPHLDARGHDFQARLPAHAVVVLGDRMRLIQIISNLLNNAAKYTPDGGRIALQLAQQDGQAQVRIDDNGNGIDPTLMPHLFDLFTQAQRRPDRTQGGLGLGLALARSLARLHGGDITAESPGPAQGSSFTLTLPLTSPGTPHTTPRAPEPLASTDKPAHSLDILVVDDNIDAADMLATWLSLQGHRARVETDPHRALQSALDQPAEVYILDIGLPGMDGYALARKLRSSVSTRRSILVALTGYGQALDMRRSREAGFDYHFVKPMSPARMAALLAQVGSGWLAQLAEPSPPLPGPAKADAQ